MDFESSASANSATPAFDFELLLISFRVEFAVSHTGANFHLWPHCRDCPDNFSALIRRDAVPASQRGVRAKHAQNSF
jgi:hypothetical protein